MTFKIATLAAAGSLAFLAACSEEQTSSMTSMVTETVMAGGAQMSASDSITENLAKSGQMTTLVATLQATGLSDALASGDTEYTLFAPTDSAFAELPDGSIATLTSPEHLDALTRVLRYHVLVGDIESADIAAAIAESGGAAQLETVTGDILTARLASDGNIELVDGRGNVATITTADVPQSNGMVHVIDTVLLPG